MTHYIDKTKVISEIERLQDTTIENGHFRSTYFEGIFDGLSSIERFIDTIEVEEVDEKYECPTIQKKDDVSVASRMEYIDEDLKPIADFILDYAEWNLHKDEWNHPVLEVPLFRVLDALAQRGKPYCCMN